MHDRLRHRHFIALPCLLAVIAGSVVSALGSLPARVVQSPAQEQGIIEAGVDTVMKGSDDVQVTTVEGRTLLSEGTLLVRTDGMADLTAGQLGIQSFFGGFSVTVRGGVVTVAALTTAVSVSDGRSLVLVPAGWQWRGGNVIADLVEGVGVWSDARSLAPLPDAFKTAQLDAIRRLPPPLLSSLPPQQQLSIPSLSAIADPLRLPLARSRAEQAENDRFVRSLLHAIDQEDAASLTTLLALERRQTFLHSMHGREILAALLSRETSPVSREASRALVLAPMADDEDVWLLAAVHPALRTEAWALFPSALSQEARSLFLFALPMSDVLPEAIPAFVRQTFSRELSQALSSEKDPALFMTVLLHSLSPVLQDSTFETYPERTQAYRKMLSDAAHAAGLDEIPSVQELLAAWEPVMAGATGEASSPNTAEDSSSSASALSFAEKDALGAQTESLLSQRGAAFTVQTAFTVISADAVHVRRVVFSSPAGDFLYDFTFHPAEQEISDIVRGDEVFPNALPLEAFLKWVKGE
ncbi:MAG: hypothetical protein V1926_01110 [Candidatus Peregrinibacteria bacterium]